jgi:hypothetical protein
MVIGVKANIVAVAADNWAFTSAAIRAAEPADHSRESTTTTPSGANRPTRAPHETGHDRDAISAVA